MRINPLGFVRLILTRINPLGEGLTEQDLREGLTEQGLNELLEFNLCEIFKWSKETPHIYIHFIPSYDYNLSCSYPRIRTLLSYSIIQAVGITVLVMRETPMIT